MSSAHSPAQSRFPDPRGFGDIVALGGDLSPSLLLDAYSHGIFPWPMEGTAHLPWFCPEVRALLDFGQIHVPRSLQKEKRRNSLRFTIDQAFSRVIGACSSVPRPGQDGTWITEEIQSAYSKLHEMGHAHSVEAWEGDALVGGIYGVDGGGVFAAESMFHTRPNASKLCLLFLVEHLQSRGLDWIDIQVMTPHLEKLGAIEESRDEFLDRLQATQSRGLRLF